MSSILTWLADHLIRRREQRTEVHLRIHRAMLFQPAQADCYFLNIYNASPEREVTITHIWLDSSPRVQVLTKPLPVRVLPRHQWETFVEAAVVPGNLSDDDVFTLGRCQLADGTIIESVKREDVPPAGFVPG